MVSQNYLEMKIKNERKTIGRSDRKSFKSEDREKFNSTKMSESKPIQYPKNLVDSNKKTIDKLKLHYPDRIPPPLLMK